MSDMLYTKRVPFSAAAATLPTALTFSLVKRRRMVTPHPASDFQIDFENNLEQASQPNMFTANQGTFTVGNGVMSLTTFGAGNNNIILINTPTPVVPSFMLSADIVFAGDATSSEQCAIGLFKDATNHAMVGFNKFANQIYWRIIIGGSTFTSTTYSQTISAFTKFGVSLTANQLTSWGYNGKCWVALATIDINSVKTFTTDLAGWKYAIWGRSDSAGSTPITLANLKITPFGGVGTRDIKLVTYENGEPLRINGSYYFTATVAALNDNTGRGCYLGVFQFDPLSYVVKQVGRLMFSETVSTVTTIFGGASGKIVFDRIARSWYVFVSTYGGPSVAGSAVAYAQLDATPLFGTTIISTHVYIPTSKNDPDLYWDGTNWNLVYCQTSINPYIKRATTVAGLVAASATALGATNNEGNIIRVIGGVAYWMTQDYTGHTWPIWRLSDLASIGALGVTLVADMYAAHPNVIPVPVAGGTKYVVVTFSNTGFTPANTGASTYCNGDILIFESQIVAGKEYADLVLS